MLRSSDNAVFVLKTKGNRLKNGFTYNTWLGWKPSKHPGKNDEDRITIP